MKICCRCKESKELSEFNKCSSRKDGYQTICRKCSNKDRSNYFKEHKEAEYKSRSIRKDNLKTFVNNMKCTQGCSICGENRSYCLDFHHIDKNKEDNISRLIVNAVSLDTLKSEIDKCIILCANCHREIHYKDSSSG